MWPTTESAKSTAGNPVSKKCVCVWFKALKDFIPSHTEWNKNVHLNQSLQCSVSNLEPTMPLKNSWV